MSVPAPVVCEESQVCCDLSLIFYGQGVTFLNAQTGFILNCPPGFSCDAGFYPTVIIVRKGEIPFTPPLLSPLRITCCDGVVLARYLPLNFTFAQFASAAQSLVNEAATHLAGCKADQYNSLHARRRTSCVITTASPLTAGEVGTLYSVTLAQTGLTAPLTWSLVTGSLPTGLSLSSTGVISGTPTTSASFGFVVRVTDAAGLSCTKLFTLSINDANAPCSVFIDDDTSFGPQALAGPSDSVSWTGLGIGSFEFHLISGAYKHTDDTCPGFSEAQFWVNAFNELGWTTTAAQSGNLTNQSNSFTNCSAGSSFGWILEADAVTDYQAGSQAGFSNIDEANTFTCDTTLSVNNVVVASSPVPVFDLVRTIKLIASQPEDLQISNLVSFANSRFRVTYGGQSTTPLALDALAATVQTALNLLPQIISDGGVTCAGTLAGGLAITWTVNGARASIAPFISTVSPGWSCQVDETQPGTGGQPEIQTLTVAPFCSYIVQDVILPVYGGTMNNRVLSTGISTLKWYDTLTPNPNAPTEQISGIQFQDSRVTLSCCPSAPLTAPTLANAGAGAVEAGVHKYAVAFLSNLPIYDNPVSGFTPGGSPIGPSDSITLGIASDVNLTNIPLGPAGTTSRIVYRTRADELEFRLLDTIADNVTTIYTDTTPDASIFLPPPPTEQFWTLTIRGVFDILGTKLSLPIWQGFKTTGLDPVGVYDKAEFLSNGFDNNPPCDNTANSIASITLTGTF